MKHGVKESKRRTERYLKKTNAGVIEKKIKNNITFERNNKRQTALES